MSEVKVKRGDRVRCLVTEYDVTEGNIYVVEFASEKGSVLVEDDVGDYWWLDRDEWEPITSLSANDTVRLKSGETFTTGSYTAEVDSVTDDKVILKHGSWLPLDAVEKVEHRFKVGDYVRVIDNSTPGGTFKPVRPGAFAKITRSASGDGWMLEGSGIYYYTDDQLEPAEPPKFKVGDRVRYTGADPVVHATLRIGATGRITNIRTPDAADVAWDDGISWPCGPLLSNLEIISPSPLEPLVVTLSIDASSFSRDLADQFQRIADSLRAA